MKILSLSFLLLLGAPGLKKEQVEVLPVSKDYFKEAIKVFPTPNNKGSITVSSANHNTLSFYLFDVEGTLIYQTTLKKNDKRMIDGLKDGTYIYNAFKNDENIEGGNVILK